MRCSAWSSLAISACSALVLAGAAHAHVVASPSFVAAGGVSAVSLDPHNDRTVDMTAFAVTVPPGFAIASVDEVGGWVGAQDGSTATWTGGHLAPDTAATFGLSIEAPPEPGAVALEVEQRYPDGGIVRSPVSLTIVPGEDSSSRRIELALVLVGLLLAASGVVIAFRRRRAGSLQER